MAAKYFCTQNTTRLESQRQNYTMYDIYIYIYINYLLSKYVDKREYIMNRTWKVFPMLICQCLGFGG